MQSLRPRSPLLAAFLPASLLLLAGCEYQPPAATGRLAAPERDKVRLVARTVEETPDSVHWKWSVIGERNWTEATVADAGGRVTAALDKTYPINAPLQRGGCNIWECDLTGKASGDTVRWEVTLHGSDGMTTKTDGTVPAGGGKRVADTLSLVQNGDRTERLPAEVTLAKIGDHPLVFRIAK